MKNTNNNNSKLNDFKKMEIKGDAVKQVKGGTVNIVIGDWDGI